MSLKKQLPPPERPAIRIGFLPLTDSAPLALAQEEGLFARYGLEVELSREVSWANLRDKLVAGHLDAAPLLAPLLLMTRFGAGGLRANLLTGLSMGLNGNAVTLSRGLWERLPTGSIHNPASAASALRRYMDTVPAGDVLTFATVHMFSMHTFQLRMWLRSGGVDPDRDVRILVLPPQQMGDSLARGIIDGFCVGEPWNTLAVQQGIGAIAALGHDIWNNGPEKVLAVTESWHGRYPTTHLRLRLALMEACTALDDAAERTRVAEILGGPGYLGLPEHVLLPALTGQLQMARHLAAVSRPDFHVFGRYQAGFPWRSQAEWMTRQCSGLLGRPMTGEQIKQLVQGAYRTDLYREAARHLGLPAPTVDHKREGGHPAPWWLDEQLELGPDLMLGGSN